MRKRIGCFLNATDVVKCIYPQLLHFVMKVFCLICSHGTLQKKHFLFVMLMPGRMQLCEINNFHQKIIQDFRVDM